MPNNPDQPFDYDTLKLRAVFVPEDEKDQVSSADIIDPLGYNAIKIPAVFVPEGGTPPGFPYERFGRTEFRPDEDSTATRRFTSGPSSSQPSGAEDREERGEPAATLPRTRYRFGAALAGGPSPAPPRPALAAGQGDPVADGTAVWRGMKTPGAVWRQSPAAPSAMRGRATAAASGTENASGAPDGGAGVRDERGPLPPGQAAGSNVNADARNDKLNATNPAGLFAGVGSGVTAGLQGESGSGSIVQASAPEPDSSSEIEPDPNSPQNLQQRDAQAVQSPTGLGTASRGTVPATGALKSAPASAAPAVHFDATQIQRKFGHAADFGVSGDYNPANAASFVSALSNHIANADAMTGTYRGIPATHYFDPNTGPNVMVSPAGDFISGWKPNPTQIESLLRSGNVP